MTQQDGDIDWCRAQLLDLVCSDFEHPDRAPEQRHHGLWRVRDSLRRTAGTTAWLRRFGAERLALADESRRADRMVEGQSALQLDICLAATALL